MDVLSIIAVAVSSGLVIEAVRDLLRRFFRARAGNSIVIKVGNDTLVLKPTNSKDAEALIATFISEHSGSKVEAPAPEVKE